MSWLLITSFVGDALSPCTAFTFEKLPLPPDGVRLKPTNLPEVEPATDVFSGTIVMPPVDCFTGDRMSFRLTLPVARIGDRVGSAARIIMLGFCSDDVTVNLDSDFAGGTEFDMGTLALIVL